ncbi:MAG: trigger factor [Selenomonadaceae bacterium]|nr:trigger factor [Selenomonadaceae bacterium]
MKVTKENLDNYEVSLTIEVEADKLAAAKKTACKNLANRLNIPGFRKGKAPKNVIENYAGKEVIMEEAADIVIQEATNDALKEENINPVTELKPEIITNEDGQDFVFKVTFTPYPEVKLGQYKGLDIEKEVEEVTEEDVDKQIKAMREHHATMIDAAEDDPIEDGDFITLDFTGYVDGKPFENGEGKSYPLQIGSNTFIPGFESGLIGAKVGEERDIDVTFPEDYHSKEMAGKPAMFKCKILSIKHQQLPELNDEFAKKVSTFETVDALRADVKKNLTISAERQAEDLQHRAAVDKATENMTVDLPPVMVENRINQLINEFTLQLQSRGMTLENYMQYSGADMDTIRENYRETAKKEVLTDVMLEEVAKVEDLKVDPKDLDYEVAMMAATYRTNPKQIVKILKENKQLSALAANVRRRKAIRFIVDNMVKDDSNVDSDAKESKAETSKQKK